ncbi:outer membrane protein assembly factor BamD [Salinisphaera sp. P385]|uniref:Outer membrane protein assembly factor BamD n=1 Tax=Spectribacter acetivorans TaxID=3075603 RepID=A0ABU3B587_9GAMM|nr:outer membrane protein assembly factor BamD [Salinisphaera sp. P385]MDT0617614.1 outer membrane protein assembly factor BamD [Salinisphaera sp. P385]
MRTSIVLVLLTAVMATLGGCASSDRADELQVARDIVGGGEGRAVARADAETLYNTARGFLDSNDPQKALELYEEIQARFPFTEFAIQAQLETIYANKAAKQPDAALAAADRFIKQHPRHPAIDYVYYLRGATNYDRVEAETVLGADPDKRDPTQLRQAFTDFNLLIRNYPDSVYRKDAQLRMINIRHRLAAHSLSIAEYYLKRRAYVAASRRAEFVVERYQGTDSIPRALEIMEHAYRKAGLEELALNAQAVLTASYPGFLVHRREFYRQQEGLEPRYDLPPLDQPPTTAGDQPDTPSSVAAPPPAGGRTAYKSP